MAAPTYVSEGHGTASVTLPATQADDILILSGLKSGAAGTPGGTYSGGSWTQAKDTLSGHSLTSWWSRATGNHSGETVTLSSYISMTVTVYRGCLNSASPMSTNSSQDVSGGSFGVVAPPAFNTTVSDVLVLLIAADISTVETWSSETKGGLAMTERVDANALSVSTLAQASSGTTGSFSATSTGISSSQLAHAFGLKPGGPTFNDSPTGTISLVGTPSEAAIQAASPSGTIAFTGTRTEAQIGARTATGTIPLAGENEEHFGGNPVVGRVTLSGTSTSSQSYSNSPSGTIVLSGTQTNEGKQYDDVRSGQLVLSGTKTEAHAFTDTRTGTIPLSGSLPASARILLGGTWQNYPSFVRVNGVWERKRTEAV